MEPEPMEEFMQQIKEIEPNACDHFPCIKKTVLCSTFGIG